MKTSGNSSAKAPPFPAATPPVTPPRKSFSLNGRSVVLDPRTHAVRRDIADIRLAEYVFAPHYAVPMLRDVARPTLLREGRDPATAVMAELTMGETFEVLEIAGPSAWGVAVAHGLVGYVDKAALDLKPAA